MNSGKNPPEKNSNEEAQVLIASFGRGEKVEGNRFRMAYEVKNLMEKIVEYMDHFNRPFNCKCIGHHEVSRARTRRCFADSPEEVVVWWSCWRLWLGDRGCPPSSLK